MLRNETDKNEENHAARFLPVLDSRKREIRGLWRRGDRYLFPHPSEARGTSPATACENPSSWCARTAGLRWVGFHDLSYFFASACVIG